MKTTFVSTRALSEASRSSLMQQASKLAKLQLEMSSGRKADVGLDLGSSTGEAVSLRSEFGRLNGIIDTNALVASRLDITQAAMGDVLTTAQDFLGTLIAVRDSDGGAEIIQPEAEAGIQLLTSRLNSSLNGSYLFAGLNTDVKPIADYLAVPASANKVALDAAFVAEFGFNQNSPLVSTITDAAMTTFLNGNFDALFANPGAWDTDWSSASDQVTRSRISTSELVETSVSANEQGFRKVAAAFTMMADLGTADMNELAFQVVVDQAISLVGEAITDVTHLMARMGSTQERVANASDRLNIQTDILNTRINELENVDPTETSARLSTALTQIETTYAVTARIQGLSLLNYL